jgi:DNA-binding PadR family transcriptional regulator
MAKLTSGRKAMLEELRDRGPGSYASYYPPLKWLVEQGFATMRISAHGSEIFEITKAGRRVLSEASKRESS